MKFDSYNREGRTEQNARTFNEAVERGIESLTINFDAPSAEAFAVALRRNGIALLGEIHGVKENSAVILSLFRKFSIRRLGLEWDQRLGSAIDTYLRSGKFPFEEIRLSGDGRISAEHFALLANLWKEGRLSEVVLFDTIGEQSWNDRDRQMAAMIEKTIDPSNPILIVAGNMHTRIEPMDFGKEFGDTSEPGVNYPMGFHLHRAFPTLPRIRLHYGSGTFFNSGIKQIDPETMKPEPAFGQQPDGTFTLTVPVAHAATVPNP